VGLNPQNGMQKPVGLIRVFVFVYITAQVVPVQIQTYIMIYIYGSRIMIIHDKIISFQRSLVEI
jgi:hypothetical protein